MFYAHEFSQTHARICPHELFEADPSLSLRAVILKVVNVVSKVRGDQLIKCIIFRGAWARNKDFTEEIYPRKGRKIVVLSLELESILGAQIYTGLTRQGVSGVGWGGVGCGGGGGGGWGLVVGFNKAFHKQMTSFQIQSYISVPQLSKQQQILSKGI